MRVRVLFFGILKDVAGRASESLELPAASSVRDALDYCISRWPEIKDVMPSVAVAVNQRYAGSDTMLDNGDEVALLPPVSGGSEGDTRPHAWIVRQR
ncbi:MAG: MoaD/ThiS family protein, partial [Candidatus Sulfotelmatobacter sp.]